MLGKDEHCSAGRQCQLPPFLCPARSPARVTSFAQEDQGTGGRREGTRKSEGDAVADAATAFRGEGTEEGALWNEQA